MAEATAAAISVCRSCDIIIVVRAVLKSQQSMQYACIHYSVISSPFCSGIAVLHHRRLLNPSLSTLLCGAQGLGGLLHGLPLFASREPNIEL